MTKDIIQAFDEGYNKGYQACKEALEQSEAELNKVWNSMEIQNALYADDEFNATTDCIVMQATIAQLQLDNERMREGFLSIDLRAIAKKVVNDASNRFVTMKPMYDSEELMVTLVNQEIEKALATQPTLVEKQND